MKPELNHNGDSPDVGKRKIRYASKQNAIKAGEWALKKYAAVFAKLAALILAGISISCVTTQPSAAPSTSPIKNSIQSAQEANKRAGEATVSAQGHVSKVSSNLSRADQKESVIVKWLDAEGK